MFLLRCLVLVTLCVYSNCAFLSPCPKNDNACFEASIQTAYSKLMAGDPALGIESLDPMYIDFIEGDLAGLKYTFTSSVLNGFAKCRLRNVRINLDAMNLHYDLDCPALNLKGQYEISGQLIVLPVQGKGDFYMETNRYVSSADCELKKVEGKDGKTYLAIKNFKLKNDAKEPIVFDFRNLFNGQKDLADVVIKFANENWKEVADFVQDPVWYTSMKKIINNLNKFLKTEPIDEIFV